VILEEGLQEEHLGIGVGDKVLMLKIRVLGYFTPESWFFHSLRKLGRIRTCGRQPEIDRTRYEKMKLIDEIVPLSLQVGTAIGIRLSKS